jgi:hypothetical protein
MSESFVSTSPGLRFQNRFNPYGSIAGITPHEQMKTNASPEPEIPPPATPPTHPRPETPPPPDEPTPPATPYDSGKPLAEPGRNGFGGYQRATTRILFSSPAASRGMSPRLQMISPGPNQLPFLIARRLLTAAALWKVLPCQKKMCGALLLRHFVTDSRYKVLIEDER